MKPLVAAAALLALAATAHAEPRRFGLFIGSNGAPEGREPLLHAEHDAERLRRVFVELGGMAEDDARLLRSPRAVEVLDALRALATRMQETPGALLVFYYSGHADDRALLFGDTELPHADLTGALEAAAPRLSLHVVDACRSGALTRLKGLAPGPRLRVDVPELGEGRVVITSSAAWEDAQESDRLSGSFFTVHLATGLRGAADADSDGAITVAEAYAYVYDRTVESTRATLAGAQHPTYRYDLRGQGETVLTRVGDAGAGAGAALLHLAGGGDYLVVDAPSGRVVAELRARGGGEELALRPGRYRVSRRTHDALHEGELELEPGARTDAEAHLTRRIAHARLVRKGGPGTPATSHEVTLAAGVRGPLGRGIGAAPMLRAGYALALPWLTLRPHLGLAGDAFGGGVETPRLRYAVRELTAGLAVVRDFDLRFVTLGAGALAELLWLAQVERDGRAPDRDALGFVFGVLGEAESPTFAGGLSATLSAELDAYSFPASDAERAPAGGGALRTVLTFRALLGLGYHF